MPVSDVSDETLVARMAARDEDALSAIYDRYRSVIFSLALRILRDRPEAEEALADVFLQAWRQADGFDRSRGTVGAWLLTLCRSRAIDRLRARGRRDALQETMTRSAGEAQEDSRARIAGAPGRVAELAMKRQRIGAALSALTVDQRTALEMAYYEGLSHSEIASALKTPLGTVKTRIRQALLTLREKLAAQFEA
jgi:RNA polymerase sigma-70 factor, ECF subfamily